jgi:hypothetical protein
VGKICLDGKLSKKMRRRFLKITKQIARMRRKAEFIGKIRLLGVKLPTSILASAAFLKI